MMKLNKKLIKVLTEKLFRSLFVMVFILYSLIPYGSFFVYAEIISEEPIIIEEVVTPTEEEVVTPTEEEVVTPIIVESNATDAELTTTPETTETTTLQDDPSANNSDTGADSNNTSETNTNTETDVSNDNNSTIKNYSFLSADTGHNKSQYNTGSGIITTQKASGQGELINIINENFIQVQESSIPYSQTGNENTGSDSNNEAIVNINNQLTIKNVNDSDTVNVLDAQVFTGENDASYNTGHGIITSEDAELGLNFVSFANANILGGDNFYADWQNIYNNYAGNIDLRHIYNTSQISDVLLQASNKSTGPGSDNSAIVDINNETTVTSQNNGKIKNEINTKVISGKNKANYNIGVGSIDTGDVKSALNVLNFLNANITASNFVLKNLNVFGNWDGSILMPQMSNSNLNISPYSIQTENTDTGSGSDNQTNSNTNTTVDVDNQNDAVITNNISLKTNTGSNIASNNTGFGTANLGQAKAETNTINVANLNITGDSWWVVVVNKFGNWNGKVLGLPNGAEVQNNSNTSIFVPQNSGIKINNKSTGADSNNSAGVNVNNTTDILNENNANILNNINVEAISGENEANYNTGNGTINTGDIKSAVNLVNFADVNITAGNWTVVVVNVFGDWNGDLVFSNPNAFDLSLDSIDLLSITADSQSKLTISAENADPALGFNATPYWFKEISGNDGANSSSDWQTSNIFINENLLPNTKYEYAVKVRDSFGGESEFSDNLSKFTLAPPPSNLSAIFASGKALLTIDKLNNDNQSQSGYYFYRTNEIADHNSGWINSNVWEDTGLDCGKIYSYSVKYRNGDGVETNSIATTLTTNTCNSNNSGGSSGGSRG